MFARFWLALIFVVNEGPDRSGGKKKHPITGSIAQWSLRWHSFLIGWEPLLRRTMKNDRKQYQRWLWVTFQVFIFGLRNYTYSQYSIRLHLSTPHFLFPPSRILSRKVWIIMVHTYIYIFSYCCLHIPATQHRSTLQISREKKIATKRVPRSAVNHYGQTQHYTPATIWDITNDRTPKRRDEGSRFSAPSLRLHQRNCSNFTTRAERELSFST